VILIIWFSQYLGLFRKEKEFNLWLDQIEKLGLKHSNPKGISTSFIYVKWNSRE
jgi:hypothetical protein